MDILNQFSQIKVFVFDVDGVLTNGQLLVMPDGNLLRNMNIKDGYALQLAVKKGYQVWIISGANDSGSAKRLENLGISEVNFGIKNKLEFFNTLKGKYQISNVNAIAYMGDDMPDIEVMSVCGMKCAPADACMEILQFADYISPFAGGNGCVRDVIEKVLKINGDWE